MYYTGDRISPKCWSKENQQVRRGANCYGADSINQGLHILADKVQAIYLDHRNSAEPLPPVKFRSLLDQFWKGRTVPEQKPVELLQFIQQLIEERTGSLSPNTLKAYTTLKNNLSAYHKETRRPVTF